MDAHELLLDRPAIAPCGEPLSNAPMDRLVFGRTFHVPAEQLALPWMDADARRPWMPLLPNVTFTIVQHAFPVFLRAVETDGVHAVEVEVGFEEDDRSTQLRLHARPLGSLTMDKLIECGYADRWEERLYGLADVLLTPTPHRK